MSDLLKRLAEKNNIKLESNDEATPEERITILEDALAELCTIVLGGESDG